MESNYEKKDFRYRSVKLMLDNNDFKSFKDIFSIIPFTTVAIDMHKNNATMKRLIEHPEQFTVDEVMRLADLIQCNHTELYALLTKDIK
jgi:hypothetical protein